MSLDSYLKDMVKSIQDMNRKIEEDQEALLEEGEEEEEV